MKASVVTEIGGGFTLTDLTIDQPQGREVLVNVYAAGLCHSDLTMSVNELGLALPATFGHELSGIVVGVGPDVGELVVGDHVVGCLVRYCGRCDKCLGGRVYQCSRPETCLRRPDEPARLMMGDIAVTQVFGLGGFAEQALVHETQLVRVPADLPFAQGALLGCAVVTGAGAVLNAAHVQTGDTVVVVGAGGVGLNAISAAALVGASKIIAIDLTDEKLETARSFGATHVVNSSKADPADAVGELTEGGADAVFDFVGLTEVTSQALRMVGVGGGLYLVGVGGVTARVDALTMEVVGTQRRIQGVMMGSASPHRDIPKYADLYLNDRLNLDDLISRRISLADINEGYADLGGSSRARVVVTDFGRTA